MRTSHSPRKLSVVEDRKPELSTTIQSRRPMIQSVTLRLRSSIARSLRQAAIERSLDYVEPFTQQDITNAALADWLTRNGYSIDE